MTNSRSNELSAEAIIHDLHLVRETIVDSFNGDLHALTKDARQRQQRSGHPVWSGKKMHQTDNHCVASSEQSTPAAG
ncbi:MAG: hypothetical protein H7Z17_13070 [Fuerstia sp.]|nr:hypothetical protein [Fuerstiella sp.]